MQQNPADIFKCLADGTRLRTLLLVMHEGELCVCEIAAALDLSQPKVSRHLAQLRTNGLLQDRRDGQWIYYQLAPQAEDWIISVLNAAATQKDQREQLTTDQQRLQQMGERPQRRAACC